MLTTKPIKDSDQVIEYLKGINYYDNKTEENVRKIFLENIQRFKKDEILLSFLSSLAIELLYFNNNIGAFKDIKLRDALLAGDELMFIDIFDVKSKDVKPLIKKLLME